MFWNKKTSASQPAHKQESLRIIATAFNCKSIEVENFYKSFQIKALVTGLGSRSQAKRAIDELNAQKRIQAAKMKFNPADTPAGLMKLWSQEVLDMISAKDYLKEANLLASNGDYDGAFKVIHKARSLYEMKFNHYLHNAEGEYYLALELELDALESFHKAIKLIKEDEPDNREQLNKYIENAKNSRSKKNIKTTIVSVETTDYGKRLIIKLANGVIKQFSIKNIDDILKSQFPLYDVLPTILVGTGVTYDLQAYNKGDQVKNENNDSPVINIFTNSPMIHTSGGIEIVNFRFGAIDKKTVYDFIYI